MSRSVPRPTNIEKRILVVCLSCSIALTIFKAAAAPITYDEAFTYLRIARKHTVDILRDYEYPNNHMLHTIAVRGSTRIFGDSAFAIRLPAIVGGIALVLGFVAIGRRFESPMRIAFPIAAAWLPVVMEYNGLARGYAPGAAAAVWALVLLTKALDSAKPERNMQRLATDSASAVEPANSRFPDDPFVDQTPPLSNTRSNSIRLLTIGLLLGISVGCVPTFGILVAGILGATMLIRLTFRPLHLRSAVLDGALIVGSIVPVLLIAYGRVRMKPREWPWGFGDWQTCNDAFWKHALDLPASISPSISLGVLALVSLACVLALHRRNIAQLLPLLALVLGIAALIAARFVLGTVWPLPRTVHWAAPFALLAAYAALTVNTRMRRVATMLLSLLTASLVVWSAARWNSREYRGWEDNAAIPAALHAVAADTRSPPARLGVPWRYDVCVEYALKRRPHPQVIVVAADDPTATHRLLASSDATHASCDVIYMDSSTGVRVVHCGNVDSN